MAAIITNTLKKQVADLLLTEILDVTDSNEYYIGIGKSDLYYDDSDTTIAPINSLREERIARANLQSVKKVVAGGASFVITRTNWSSGGIYSGYSDTATTDYPYYVITDANEVYICLQAGKTSAGANRTSTVKPDYSSAGVLATKAFKTADGYTWKYLYTLTTVTANNFLSSTYMPTQFIVESAGDATLTPFETVQAEVKEAAIPGQILGVNITNGGTGYTSAPTVTFRGNGDSAQATAFVSGGTIVKIEMANESAGLGSGYNYASVHFSGGGGTGAAARPIIGPSLGIGYDPRDDLKSTSIMLTAKPDGDEGGDFLVDNQDFRQIVLFKNLELKDSSARYTDATGKALRSLLLDTGHTITVDTVLSGDSADAFVDQVDGDVIYYHQNEKLNFGTFANEAVTDDDGGSGTILQATDSGGRGGAEVDAFSGDVLYIENRARVIRTSAQAEDIKIVLSF